MTKNPTPITLFFDGQCRVCRFEMTALEARDLGRCLRLIDISSPDFDPSPWGLEMPALMAQIHALRPDGSLVKGVSALHLAYRSVGWEWPFIGMRWRPGQVLYEKAYSVFARNRQQISKTLSPLIWSLEWIQARRTTRRMQRCQQQGSNHCEIDPRTGNPSR